VTAVKADQDAAFGCLSDTQRRLLEEFGRRGVRFIVIGGYAIRFYGRLRPAHDLDLVVDCAESNLQQIQRCLETLGARKTDQIVQHLASGVRQYVKWNDTELWSSNFDRTYECLERDAVPVRIGGAAGLLISKARLITAKCEATRLPERDKRSQDYADLAYLSQGER
jgi:hypothetical protein